MTKFCFVLKNLGRVFFSPSSDFTAELSNTSYTDNIRFENWKFCSVDSWNEEWKKECGPEPQPLLTKREKKGQLEMN